MEAQTAQNYSMLSSKNFIRAGNQLLPGAASGLRYEDVTPPPVHRRPAPRRQHIKKYSVGIACIRFINDKPHVIMICKRYSYAFGEFVYGKYPQYPGGKYVKKQLIELFSNMTVEEKIDILYMDFDRLWHKIWLTRHKGSSVYHTARDKFEAICVNDGAQLRKLINKSNNSHLVWEIPKGRKKSRSEPEVNCAIREFEEETNIAKNMYRLIPGARMTFSHHDKGVEYVNTYFVAIMSRTYEPKVSFNTQIQLHEVSDIRWVPLEHVEYLDQTNMLAGFVKNAFAIAKKYHKGQT